MTATLILFAIAVLVATTWLAALNLALIQTSASALEERLDDNRETRRSKAADWLVPRLFIVAQGVALLRTAGRVGFSVLVLAAMVGMGDSVALKAGTMAAAFGIATVALWFFTSVLASAIADHARMGVVVGSLPALRLIHVLTLPLTRLVSFVDGAVRRLSGAHLHTPPGSDELLRNIEDTQREGGLDAASATLLENVVEFTGTTVSEIMTPRSDIEALAYTDDLAAIRHVIAHGGHSRIPVYRGGLDEIVGILYVKDLVRYLGAEPQEFRLLRHLRQPIRVPETKRVSDLLRDFQRSEVHMALVIDEHGSTSGLVTIEDVLEEIVGEIRDEHEPVQDEEPELRRLDDRTAEPDGRFRVDALNDALGIELPDDEGYDTVAGLVLAHFGRVPTVGESFEANGVRFTVLEATPMRINRVRVEILAEVERDSEVSRGVGRNG